MTTCEEYVLAELKKYKNENSKLMDFIIQLNKQLEQKDKTIKMLESHLSLQEKKNDNGG